MKIKIRKMTSLEEIDLNIMRINKIPINRDDKKFWDIKTPTKNL